MRFVGTLLAAALVVLGSVAAAAAPASAATVRSRRSTTTVPRAPTSSTAPPPPAASILVDVASGRVLSASNEHQPLPPASLTKVITALVALDRLAPDAPVPVSDRAANSPAFFIGMKAGQVWPVQDALTSLLVSSANDAAVALAEASGGSLDGYSRDAEELGRHLGFADSPVIHDPAGLDDPIFSVDGGNRISARDLAIAARNLLAQPRLATLVASRTTAFTGPDGVGHKMRNHNWRFLDSYAGAIGVKTGYTRRAKQCHIVAATRDGRTLLAVILGAPGDPLPVSAALLDAGFAMPADAAGTGDVLPPVVDDLGPTRVRSDDAAVVRGFVPGGSSGSGSSGSNSPRGSRSRAPASVAGSPFGPFSSPGLLAVGGGLGLGTVGVAARRRQVRRRKGKRRARRRHPTITWN
ncbi:MAG TPA: serine hydrolase [Acidimicrobiales bacterium]|nr:serine hydrolase [Acidimicrobiales bacterium]